MKMQWAFVLVLASTTIEAADISSGSGVVIGAQGEILTNSHVVESCAEITVHFPRGNLETAVLVARDEKNDLAAIQATGARNIPATSVATFRDGVPVRAGDAVIALGYPHSGLLASNAIVSVGYVSALAGLGDDPRYLQISAPVQSGNSGGPLLDVSGGLIGIVSAKLNAARMVELTGDMPQNVNFALKAEVARKFLDMKGIAYRKGPSDKQGSAADVGDIARPFTVRIECKHTRSQITAALATQQDLPANKFPDLKKVERYYSNSVPSSPLPPTFATKLAPGSAIDVANVAWEQSTITSGCLFPCVTPRASSADFTYQFTLKNKTAQSIRSITYIATFYGRNGAVAHSVEKTYYGHLLRNLVTTVEGDEDLPDDVRGRVTKFEVRVQNYELENDLSESRSGAAGLPVASRPNP